MSEIMRARFVNEHINFEQSKDPLSSLNLGQKHLITKWLDEMQIKSYVINDDFTIDVINGDVDISNKNLIELPSYINFRKVDGSFYCQRNGLITLRGCPIKSFNFWCRDNQLYSLKDAPEYVANVFRCDINHLSSLEYLPKHIGTLIFCAHNDVNFSKEQVKKYCDLKDDTCIII